MTGPDFIVMGAMKCATSTLQEQLSHQAGVFMTDPKEPNFFSDDAIYRRGMDWYQGLFSVASPGSLKGEASTHYTKLPTHPQTVSRLREAYPDVKLIYVMRNPMDRIVSHFIHGWTQRDMPHSLERAVRGHPELVSYGCYAMQLAPYLRTFGPEQILPIFFERLTAFPQSELERIARFLGIPGEVRWEPSYATSNVSRDRLRRSAIRDRICGIPGVRQIARRTLPEHVRERAKDVWRMTRRPTLSEATERSLVRTFDRDLALLGRWLGCTLECDGFGERVAQLVPEWTSAVETVR